MVVFAVRHNLHNRKLTNGCHSESRRRSDTSQQNFPNENMTFINYSEKGYPKPHPNSITCSCMWIKGSKCTAGIKISPTPPDDVTLPLASYH
jgi:hypothetical protein